MIEIRSNLLINILHNVKNFFSLSFMMILWNNAILIFPYFYGITKDENSSRSFIESMIALIYASKMNSVSEPCWKNPRNNSKHEKNDRSTFATCSTINSIRRTTFTSIHTEDNDVSATSGAKYDAFSCSTAYINPETDSSQTFITTVTHTKHNNTSSTPNTTFSTKDDTFRCSSNTFVATKSNAFACFNAVICAENVILRSADSVITTEEGISDWFLSFT